jgi:hypothetical protein
VSGERLAWWAVGRRFRLPPSRQELLLQQYQFQKQHYEALSRSPLRGKQGSRELTATGQECVRKSGLASGRLSIKYGALAIPSGSRCPYPSFCDRFLMQTISSLRLRACLFV